MRTIATDVSVEWYVCLSVSQSVSLQKRLHGSGSCLGWRLLGAWNIVLEWVAISPRIRCGLCFARLLCAHVSFVYIRWFLSWRWASRALSVVFHMRCGCVADTRHGWPALDGTRHAKERNAQHMWIRRFMPVSNYTACESLICDRHIYGALCVYACCVCVYVSLKLGNGCDDRLLIFRVALGRPMNGLRRQKFRGSWVGCQKLSFFVYRDTRWRGVQRRRRAALATTVSVS